MYSLRYWYEQKHKDGKVVRLEIHKKNNSAAPLEIGDVVQGLSLNIEGGEDNIDVPIVSTSLVMTFVDAYDHHEAEAKKCGNWAEFYTPDATLWKVVLLCKDAGASAFRTLWGGYVTPDSYEEDLVYRGTITIVARDNIGHLADFPFDATGDDYGTISLRELLAEAWLKIESPMSLRAYDDWMQTEGVSALDTRLNVSAFKDKSWHEAIEAALYAYGAAMRFIGDNEVMVSPLRYIANFGGSFTQSQPIFMTGATRMLTPAVKRIEETASYDLEAELQPLVKPSDFSGERTLLDRDSDIYGYYLSNTEEGKGWLSSDYHTIFFDPSSFGILEADSVGNLKNQMYVVAIEDYAYTAEYSRYVLAQSAKVKVTFGTGFMRKRYTDANGMPTGGYYLVPRTGTITKAYFMISVTQNGVKQYLKPNGEWAATPTAFSKANDSGLTEIEHDIDLSDFTGTILLKIEIGGIVATIPYVGISAFSIGTNEAVSLLQTNRVNTNYSEENNVIIKRDPVIAPAYNTTILPSIIKNGIFYLDGVTYKPAKAWAWAGDTPQQMAVYNHLQLLTFYAKPNNVVEGNIMNGDVSRFAHIWRFEGKEHILVSGRYNYISGFIEGAILREFARYESLWGSTGEAQLPATETSEETNKESSASSSSAASTYDNTTLVNIGSGGGGGASNLNDLQDVDVTASVAGSVLYFNGTGWVDKTIHSLLAELKAIGDWFYKTDDGKSIGTKFNFFSEQEVSANGLSTGCNGGGGLISQVFGKSAFGTIATESNKATFNAYAIDSLYKRIVSLENKEVDLTGYATEAWVAGQGFITSAALSPYMKTADANDTFATKTALNNLSSSHDSLATRVSTAESNISTNVKGIADNKTAIATNKNNISANATAITNLGKRVTANEGNIAEILKWFAVDADGNLYTTYNLYSTKEISANGLSIGSGSSGGGLISQVYGTTALGTITSESNSATFNAYAIDSLYKRIVSLEGKATAVSFVPALTSGKQIGTLSIDGVSTVLYGVDAYSKADADSTFLKLSGGTITFGEGNNGLKLSNSRDSANYLLFEGIVNGNKNLLGALGMSGYNSPVYVSPTGFTYTLYHTGNFNPANYLPLAGGTISGNTYIPLKVVGTSVRTSIGFSKDASAFAYLTYNGGSSWAVTNEYYNNEYALLHSDNYNSYALPLSGGTISGGAGALEIKRNGPYLSNIKFSNTDGELGKLGFVWANNPAFFHTDGNYYPLYHTGNFNPANYLPLAGGTISGSGSGILTINRTSGTPLISFQANGTNVGFLGIDTVSRPCFVDPVYYETSYLIHSGNIGSQSVDKATRLHTGGGGTDLNELLFSDYSLRYYSAISSETPNIPDKTGWQNALLALPLHGNGVTAQFYFTANTSQQLYYRSTQVNAWKTIAFTDSNVASAQALSNANGTVAMSVGTSADLYVTKGKSLFLAKDGEGIYLGDNGIFWHNASNVWTKTSMVFNSSGNVTIGSSDLAGTDYKLVINGLSRFKNNIESDGNVIGAGAVQAQTSAHGFISLQVGSTGNKGLLDSRTSWIIYTNGTNTFLPQGNVGIGTTSPEQKLHISGGNAVVTKSDNTSTWLKVQNTNGAVSLLSHTSRGVYDSTNSKWLIGTNGTNSFLLCGNVGIGTDGPAYKLDVSGTSRFTDTVTAKSLTISDTSMIAHIAFSRGSANYLYAPSGGTISFVTNGKGISGANSDLVISNGIIYPGTTGVTKLGYGDKRWSSVASVNGDFSGDVTASTFKTSSTLACGGRLRVTTNNSANSFGYLKTTAVSSALNVGLMHIGTNYGGTSDINSTAVDMTAISIYRGVVGFGKEYDYTSIRALYDNNIKMEVDGNAQIVGTITARSGIKISSGQALTFLDASGVEHKLTYDSTAGAFKFDGNILVLGDGQFNAIN